MELLLYCTIAIILAMILVGIYLTNNFRHRIDALGAVFGHIPYYIFLVNDHVEVKKTNYYHLNPQAPPSKPIVLGNVLRCKNGCDSGCCGTHELCGRCIIRAHIVKSLINKTNFDDVEAHMRLYNANNEAIDTDVSVSGSYVDVDEKPHMVITVRDITTYKTLQKRLIEKEYRLNHSERERDLYLKFIHDYSDDLKKSFDGVDRITTDEETTTIKNTNKSLRDSLQEIMIMTTDEEGLKKYNDLLGSRFRIVTTKNPEEALTAYINADLDAIIIDKSIDMKEACILNDAIRCSSGNIPIIRAINKGGKAIGDFEHELELPLTQEAIESISNILKEA